MTTVEATLTIDDVEQKIQAGIEELRRVSFGGAISEALKYLLPSGKRVLVELEKDGRRKRRAISPDWRPEEVVLYYEDPQGGDSRAPSQQKLQITKDVVPDVAVVIDQQIGQLCTALAEAEKAGKSFIALKWFRDEALTAHGFIWANDPEARQAVLAKAIEVGAVVTSKIPNPRAPLHPTTTIKLNGESKYAQTAAPRFRPIKLRGDGPSASEMVIRDRGRF